MQSAQQPAGATFVLTPCAVSGMASAPGANPAVSVHVKISARVGRPVHPPGAADARSTRGEGRRVVTDGALWTATSGTWPATRVISTCVPAAGQSGAVSG